MAERIETMAAEEFKNIDGLKTQWDSPESDQEQYAEGLRLGAEMEYISISINGVWGGRTKDGASIQSYEKIGYHRSTGALMRGFLDSGVAVFVYRYDGSCLTEYKIQ